jgi:hypothetical protein
MQAGDLSGSLVVSVKGFISWNPTIIAMGPDKNYNETGPSRAMVVWRERDVVLLQVHVLVCNYYHQIHIHTKTQASKRVKTQACARASSKHPNPRSNTSPKHSLNIEYT